MEDDVPTTERMVFTLSEWDALKAKIDEVDKEILELKTKRPEYQRQNANMTSGEEFDVENVIHELCENKLTKSPA